LLLFSLLFLILLFLEFNDLDPFVIRQFTRHRLVLNVTPSLLAKLKAKVSETLGVLLSH
jgi:hypothetical protein